MTIEVDIKGTLAEIGEIFGFEKTCELCCVDPYKVGMVPAGEQFEVTTEDLVRVGLLSHG